MLTVFAGQAVCSIFIDRFEFVELVFAQAFGSEIECAQGKTDYNKNGQNNRGDPAIAGKKKVVGKLLRANAGGGCRQYLG